MNMFFGVIAALIALAPIGTFAHECARIDTPRVSLTAAGYTPVVVRIKVPVADGLDAKDEARKADFAFWMEGKFDKLLGPPDSVLEMKRCSNVLMARDGRMLSRDMLLIKLRAFVSDKEVDEEGYVLISGLPLPADLVSKKPEVGTTLASGAVYRGQWGSVDGTDTLTLLPVVK